MWMSLSLTPVRVLGLVVGWGLPPLVAIPMLEASWPHTSLVLSAAAAA